MYVSLPIGKYAINSLRTGPTDSNMVQQQTLERYPLKGLLPQHFLDERGSYIPQLDSKFSVLSSRC